MAYITISNSLKILKNLDFEAIGDFGGDVYVKPIYFFSKYEENNLLFLKQLLKNPEKFIKEYYVPIVVTDNFKYVYEGTQPAYHFYSGCDRLISNYKNFEIPEEIRKRSKEEILRFRKWFKVNEYLLEKPEIFAARLHLAFNVMVNPKEIDYANSGVEVKENLNLEELEKRINQYLSDAGVFFRSANEEKKEILRKYQKYTFLAYTSKKLKNNTTPFDDQTIKNILKQYDIRFKRPVKELLIEYYRIKHNPDLKFEGQLLEQLGFKPCAACQQEKKSSAAYPTKSENKKEPILPEGLDIFNLFSQNDYYLLRLICVHYPFTTAEVVEYASVLKWGSGVYSWYEYEPYYQNACISLYGLCFNNNIDWNNHVLAVKDFEINSYQATGYDEASLPLDKEIEIKNKIEINLSHSSPPDYLIEYDDGSDNISEYYDRESDILLMLTEALKKQFSLSDFDELQNIAQENIHAYLLNYNLYDELMKLLRRYNIDIKLILNSL
jgi:hypothetical protein